MPETVRESQDAAHTGPEASANPEAVQEKKEVEDELTSHVKPSEEAGEPAPTLSAATAETAPGEPVIEDENTAAAIAAAHDPQPLDSTELVSADEQQPGESAHRGLGAGAAAVAAASQQATSC